MTDDGIKTLAAEYRALGIPLEPTPIDRMVRAVNDRLIDEVDAIVLTDSPQRHRRRFTVRRVKVYGIGCPAHPWVIKDRTRAAWLGFAPTREAAFLAIARQLESEACA